MMRSCAPLLFGSVLMACGGSISPQAGDAGSLASDGSEAGAETAALDCSPFPIYAAESFYRERREDEGNVKGVVVYLERDIPGPDERYHPYRVGAVAMYVGSVDMREKLKPFIGARVSVRGKMVDVGYGKELWPASLQRECP